MSQLARIVTKTQVWIIVVIVASASMRAQRGAETGSSTRDKKQPLNTEVFHMGDSEGKRVVKGAFYPARQPEIYWRDQDISIDLIISSGGEAPYSLHVQSANGRASSVELPRDFAQVDSIYRAPEDKAIIVGECGGTCNEFAIVDLNEMHVIDDIGVENLSISPNRRFILYDNGYNLHSEDNENLYHLYDTLKTPRENTCGYRDNDPKHESLDETMRGFQVYPQKPGQLKCTFHENDEEDDDNVGTNFTWSDDSSKIVFADLKRGAMSLVLVTMPVGANDLPKTSVHGLQGTQDVCTGATDAAGEKYCDYHEIQSLGWDGDSVKASFHHQFGTPLNLGISIPVSAFVPIGK